MPVRLRPQPRVTMYTPRYTPSFRRRRSPFRRILAAIAVLLILAAIGAVGTAGYVGWQLTHPKRLAIDQTPADFGLAYEAVSFPSREDGLVLRGWFLPAADSPRTVIFAHGYRSNRLQPSVPALDLAREMVNAGFNVLTFDFRNSGESDGELTSVGQFEVRDLLGAVDYVRSRGRAGQQIGVIGFSMGASVTILAAASEPRIAAAVADSPFADLELYLRENLPVWSGLPAFPFNSLILGTAPVITGLEPGEVRPIEAMGQLRQPVLLIHGAADTVVPPSNSQMLWNRSLHPSTEIWLVPGAGHVKAYATAREEYLAKVLGFFRTHLGSPETSADHSAPVAQSRANPANPSTPATTATASAAAPQPAGGLQQAP